MISVRSKSLGSLHLRSALREHWARDATNAASVFSARHSFYTPSMAMMVEMHHTGCAPGVRSEIAAFIEHELADRTF